MSSHDRYPGQAFGGGALNGSNLVKLVYFDESGTGQIERDPDLIVAGAMIDADRQYVELRAYLRDMLDAYKPKGARRPKCLHAKDIYHGTGDFSGVEWAKVKFELLADVAKIPEVFNIPLFGAAVDRMGAAAALDLSDKYRDLNCYTISAGCCVLQVEKYMRQHASGEVAQLTFEDVGKLRTKVKETYRFLADPGDDFLNQADARDYLPIERIVDAPTHQDKTDSSVLQIADYCAFALKRFLRKSAGYEALFTPLIPYFIDLSYGYGEGNPHAIVEPV